MGESFTDLVVHGGVEGYSFGERRERLRSTVADFVAESRFGRRDRGV